MVKSSFPGALMSGLLTSEVLAGLIGTVAFNFIYIATVSLYEGFIFFVGAAIFAVCLPMIRYEMKFCNLHSVVFVT
jgi:hypothetical protein